MEAIKNLAVLIDADNANPNLVNELLAEIANYGVASVKRIYGDWTSTSLNGWKEHLLEHAIQPIQQFAYTKGKNATDSAMIIDGMDLLFTKKFQGFCIISSDSDFTRLASRLRESGLTVYGFGEQKTPKPFVSACDKFIYTEVLRSKIDSSEAIKPKTRNQLRKDGKLVYLLRNACEAGSDDAGWIGLGAVGSNLAKQSSEFDPRNYGFQKLGELIRATELFDVEERQAGAANGKALYIRDKRQNN